MSADPENLYAAAVELPEEERAALVMRLLDSMNVPPDVARAQAAESVSRRDGVRSGDLNVIDEDEAFRLIDG